MPQNCLDIIMKAPVSETKCSERERERERENRDEYSWDRRISSETRMISLLEPRDIYCKRIETGFEQVRCDFENLCIPSRQVQMHIRDEATE